MNQNRILYRGFRTLFWVGMANLIAQIVLTVIELIQSVYYSLAAAQNPEELVFYVPAVPPEWIISGLMLIAYVAIFFSMARVSKRYVGAAILQLLVTVAASLYGGELAAAVLYSVAAVPTLYLFTLAGAIVVAILQVYFEYTAHRDVLTGVDDRLARGWHRLWVWSLICYMTVIGCIVLLSLGMMLNLYAMNSILVLAVFAAALGVLAIGIIRWVLLYKSGSRFKNA